MLFSVATTFPVASYTNATSPLPNVAVPFAAPDLPTYTFVLASVLPARRAAQLHPVQALRYE